MAKKRGLGKGLGALIPVSETGPTEVPIDVIAPNPMQPRQDLDLEALEELAVARLPRALFLIKTAPQPIEQIEDRDKLAEGASRSPLSRLHSSWRWSKSCRWCLRLT